MTSEENRDRHIQIGHLKKYPEFYALRMELEAFANTLDNIDDIKIDGVSRVTLAEEVYGRRYASNKIKDLLSTLGLIDKTSVKRDLTHE